jgi:Putative inner membrane protein (DUF1819)
MLMLTAEPILRDWRITGPYLPTAASKNGLISETRLFLQAYSASLSLQQARDDLINRLLPQRSRETRVVIARNIQARFTRWNPPAWVLDDLVSAGRQDDLSRLRALLLLHHARQETLLYDVVQQLVVPRWQGGQLQVSRDDALAFLSEAAVRGEGRVWVAVTAHGDTQALQAQANVQQEQYAKINSMINASLSVPELQTFLRSFNAMQSERRFHDRQRWQDLLSERDAAEAAATAQLAKWTADARRHAEAAIAGIPDLVREAGATDEQIEEHAPQLHQPFEQLLAELPEQPTVASASPLGSRLGMLDLNLRGELERLREQFNPPPPPRRDGNKIKDGDPPIPYGGIQLRDYVSDEPITCEDELDAALARVRATALRHYARGWPSKRGHSEQGNHPGRRRRARYLWLAEELFHVAGL